MIREDISFARLAHFLIIIVLTTYILIIGKPLLAPLAFATLFAFILKPLCAELERYVAAREIAVILTFLLIFIPLIGALGLFGLQLVNVFSDIPALLDSIQEFLEGGLEWIGTAFDINIDNEQVDLYRVIQNTLDEPMAILTASLTSSTAMLASFLLTVVFTFFFLLYRTSFKNFLIGQFGPLRRESASEFLDGIQMLMQRYLYGLIAVIFILGILNSIGLLLIGLDYAVFWGFLAAVLAIIPYIGTTLGGTLPFLYAFASTGSWVKPLLVVVLYVTVQTLEGNFITPKVVGGSIRINPMAAILALLVGGYIWGIAGMVLSLPLVAVLKIVLEKIDSTRALGELIGSDLFYVSDKFLNEYSNQRFRIMSMFRNRSERARQRRWRRKIK